MKLFITQEVFLYRLSRLVIYYLYCPINLPSVCTLCNLFLFIRISIGLNVRNDQRNKLCYFFIVHSEKWEHLTIKTKLKIDDSSCMFSILLEAKHFENENFYTEINQLFIMSKETYFLFLYLNRM